MRKLVAQFLASESGATAIEYALIGTLISIAIIAGALALGTSLNVVYTNLGAKMSAAAG